MVETVVLPGHVVKLGAGHAGREHRAHHARVAQLEVQRLAEAQHEALGRAVGGIQRGRLVGPGRGDVQHVARMAIHHVFDEQLGQVHERDHVQFEHGVLALPGDVHEFPEQAQPGIVDQDLDGPARRLKLVVEPLGSLRRGQVHRHDLDLHAIGFLDLLLDLAQLILTPRHQDQARAARRQPVSKGHAQSARRPGHQGGLTV